MGNLLILPPAFHLPVLRTYFEPTAARDCMLSGSMIWLGLVILSVTKSLATLKTDGRPTEFIRCRIRSTNAMIGKVRGQVNWTGGPSSAECRKYVSNYS